MHHEIKIRIEHFDHTHSTCVIHVRTMSYEEVEAVFGPHLDALGFTVRDAISGGGICFQKPEYTATAAELLEAASAAYQKVFAELRELTPA